VDGTGFFKKMRKSLGNKRNEVCEDQCREITRLYGALADNRYVRLFDNRDFGYRRLTVERPLKLNFAVTPDRLARLEQAPAFERLATSKKRADSRAAQAEITQGLELQQTILATLAGLAPQGEVENREKFATMVKAAFREAGVAVPAPLFKAILAALSERDETADVCIDAKGNPEPDPELRDYENVPLKEDVGGRSCPTCLTPGRTKPRPGWATRSISTAIFISTPRPGPWRRLRRTSNRSSRTSPRGWQR
jgi:type I restriction enzyme M protein